MKKVDFIFIAAVLLAAAVFLVIYMTGEKGSVVVLYDDRTELGRYPLDDDLIIPVQPEECVIFSRSGEEYHNPEGYNIVVIENGTAYIREADCSNQICVHTPSISQKGETIVCMPHKFYIAIE